MPRTIQIRNVSEKVHKALKARAAHEPLSLSDFIKRELESLIKREMEDATEGFTMREWLERTSHTKPVPATKSSAQIIRELRGG